MIPPVPREALRRARWRALQVAPHFVYRYYDADGVLLYVGCTADPARRHRAHQRTTHWFPEVARRTVAEFPDRQSGREAESRAIATERPVHNIQFRRPEVVEMETGVISRAERKRAALQRVSEARAVS